MTADHENEAEVMSRADAVANQVLEEEGQGLAEALQSGNVTDVEREFYRVFRRIYLKGRSDGLKHR